MYINKSGLWGEVLASRYLRDRGYDIVAGNYRCRLGEIDIIAEKDGVVCFVEVKTRNENPMYEPKEAVDPQKQRKLIAAAGVYLREIKTEVSSRFDVVEVTLDENYKPKRINHIKNAF